MTERDWTACDRCDLPAVCIGADPVVPERLCGDCCPTPHHGRRHSPQASHAVAEGYDA